MSVGLDLAAGPRIHSPTPLMDVVLWGGPPRPVTYYDVLSKGDRFIIDVMSSPPVARPIIVAAGGR
jgi:hypothetical protein